MSKKSNRTYKSKSVSLEPDFIEAATARAKELRLSWSEYVRRCLEIDLDKGGSLTIKPKSKSSGEGTGKW